MVTQLHLQLLTPKTKSCPEHSYVSDIYEVYLQCSVIPRNVICNLVQNTRRIQLTAMSSMLVTHYNLQPIVPVVQWVTSKPTDIYRW